MTTLESPLEALAFNYLSFGLFTVVNSIWTWLAVVTAAFSFWRIKTSSPILLKPAPRYAFSNDASLSSVDDKSNSSFEESRKTASAATTVTSLSLERGTKGRFTSYFEEDNILRTYDGEEAVEEDNVRGDSKILWSSGNCLSTLPGTAKIVYIHPLPTPLSDSYCCSRIQLSLKTEELCNDDWYESWERVIRTRRGEMGWYSYQDMMVVDGNVVKLWEGCRRRRKVEATTLFSGVVRTW